ncbi:Kanamycin B dioxygenase [Paramyrothecium foliicola]|nr:Kanamycin B dioxygenase [Paramyrothecium foliicola]
MDHTSSPRRHLEDHEIAQLFHSYVSEISLWYDLSDSTYSFGKVVPFIALEEPLLFFAIIALSAMHACKTSAKNLLSTAERYHASCVQLLISLEEGDQPVQRGVALAATCLLRSYEILGGKQFKLPKIVLMFNGFVAGEVDPNLHLRGAYSMAATPSMLSETAGEGLLEVGFWNYLREDITFSLHEVCPLKIRLDSALPKSRSFATVRSPQPGLVSASSEEVEKAWLSPRNLEKAVRHMHQDGFVVVENVISHEYLDILNKKMVEDASTLLARGDKGPFNYNKGNIQQDPPPVAEYFFPAIFTNPIATQITSAVLGPRPKWTFCSANSAMVTQPGATKLRQPVHSDADFAHPDHPFALVINVPLVTTTPENGSTEIWLGTHNKFGVDAQEGAHGERASGRIKERYLKERRSISPPLQPVVKKGSIIVRDLRLWHAGMPNTTGQTRVMLAMIHFAPWYRNMMRLEFGADIKPILEKSKGSRELDIEIPVGWVDKNEAMNNYLDRGFGNSYDFNQEA